MNGRLKLIEQQLLGINSATFQNLCDTYLALREQNFASFNRTGSQLGKQKTVKGTPDTFFRLADGSLRYIEYTTKANGIVAKIKADINACLNPKRTGVPVNQVNKIIICFNSRLNPAEETTITHHAASKNVHIELIGLDWLAIEIFSKYLILAKDFLGMALDTGQLLPIQNFIEEYNNKGGKLSTPLDNIFLNRKTELLEIETLLTSNELIIISGFPGVGKTKIALESLGIFISNNNDYTAFAISKKDQDISEDLKILLQQDQNYVLLVDDANRQLPNFKQILGIFKESRRGNIKLLITVRDYALNDVENECLDFSYKVIEMKKFTDEEIVQLISSASFEILNPKYQRRIVAIADGNARLAIMASLLAKKDELEFLYGEGERVFELYDIYFKTFIKDFRVFENKTILKTLGIISFFFTIDRSNKGMVEKILEVFDLDYYEFNEAIDELEKRELVEVKYSNARVSEQIMAMYFFYKVFIKDELLSFKTLLFTFYPKWRMRFSETIIPANNSFGYENVFSKVNSTLDEYLISIYSNEEDVLEFFSLFWFYKREATLNYFYQKINRLPEPENMVYNSDFNRNVYGFDEDKTLSHLGNFLTNYTESFLPALKLAFEYCRKKPDALPELIKVIKANLIFDEDDRNDGFARQVNLFVLLKTKINENKPHFSETFFALSSIFLLHYYQISKGGRKNSITIYEYPLPLNSVTKGFRESIWSCLFQNFAKYPEKVFDILRQYPPRPRTIPEILEFDLLLLLPFIENTLDRNDFECIHYVHDLVAALERKKSESRKYLELKEKFSSKEYEIFKKLDWNSLRGKQDYEFEKYEDFEKLKEEDLRATFIFKSKEDFNTVLTTFNLALTLKENVGWGIFKSLDIILEENFNLNNELGFELLESVLSNYPNGLSPLRTIIKLIVEKSEEWPLRLWKILNNWQHEYKIYWQLSFFDFLQPQNINQFYQNELVMAINSINSTKYRYYLNFSTFEKFTSIDKDILKTILVIIVEKIEKNNLLILPSNHFFEKYSESLKDNFELLSKAYLQQENQEPHFDLQQLGLKCLIEINPAFLLLYLESLHKKGSSFNIHINEYRLGFVWSIDKINSLMESAASLIIEKNQYLGISKHVLNIFFYNLNDEQKSKASQWLLDYIKKFNTNRKKMNAIFDVLRHSMKDSFEELFLSYLRLNTNLDDFIHISWRGNGGVYSGDVIIGEIHAAEWRKINEIVEKSENQLDLIPIKAYIKDKIRYELLSAEEDRKRKFTNPDES